MAVAVVGPLVLRIYSELLIVVFKIHQALEDVLDELVDQNAPDVSA